MLVIRRRAGQSVLIGDGVEIEILDASPGKVKLGITAPREILVLRKEIRFTREENLMAAQGVTPEAVRSLVARIRSGADPVRGAGLSGNKLADGNILPGSGP
jgi:carbon storage regulator